MSGPLFHFNGLDAESGRHFEPPLTWAAVQRRLAGKLPEPEPRTTGVRLDVNPDSLAESGWGVVWPAEVDPAIEEALSPLLELRRSQVEGEGPGRFWNLRYRGGGAEAFLSSHGASIGGPVNPKTFPYYLLLIGEAGEIPFDFQHRLARAHLVGRLCLDSAEAYRHYARNVVELAMHGGVRPRRAVVFAPSHPDDLSTKASLEYLARPILSELGTVTDWRAEGILAGAASKQRLLSILGGKETPAVLFTAGHSLCYRADSKVLQAKQGGLLCADWPGPVQWGGSNPPEHYIIAEDIKDDVDLRGLITCHFGCYSAGTPKRDSFPAIVNSQVSEGRHLSPKPFVAALPKRLLGHPRGALACIGHVDRAWTHSFYWGEIPGQIAVFESAFRGLMVGLSVGRALSAFAERRGAVSEEVMRFWLRKGRGEAQRQALESELWIRYHDARSYILLGDPAAKLSFAEA